MEGDRHLVQFRFNIVNAFEEIEKLSELGRLTFRFCYIFIGKKKKLTPAQFQQERTQTIR